jgi:hypothetical protein
MVTCSGAPPVFVRVMSSVLFAPRASSIETVPGVTFSCPACNVRSACTTEPAIVIAELSSVVYRSSLVA